MPKYLIIYKTVAVYSRFETADSEADARVNFGSYGSPTDFQLPRQLDYVTTVIEVIGPDAYPSRSAPDSDG